MQRKILPFLAAILGMAALPLSASAYEGTKIWKPYVIEKTCKHRWYDCTVRMDYAPLQNSMVARPGSYWYQKPFLHYGYGDFEPRHGRCTNPRHHHHGY